MIVDFHKRVLDNGLKVLHERRKNDVAAIFSTVNYGSSYEPIKYKGIAHLFEHMAFKGTEKRTQKQISEDIEKTGGKINAFTSDEITSYWCIVPSKHFRIGAEITSELVTNPILPINELEKEKKVVWEEAKMYHDNPMRGILDYIKRNMFKKPFGESALGTKETLFQIKREDLLGMHKQKYLPNNSIFCVVGNVDFKDVLETAKRQFQGHSTHIKNVKTADKLHNKTTELRNGLNQAHLCFGIHVPYLGKEGHAAEVIATLLTGGMSSILWQEIREKRNLAYEVKGYLDQGSYFGYYSIYVGCDKKNVKSVLDIIKKETKNLKSISQRELSEAKEQLIGRHKVDCEHSEGVAVGLLDAELRGKAEDFYRYPEKISEVKLNDVKKLADIKNYGCAVIAPKK